MWVLFGELGVLTLHLYLSPEDDTTNIGIFNLGAEV